MKKIVIASILASASLLFGDAVDGKACIACHGVNWEKHAMNRPEAKIVKDMTHAEIAAVLKGYRDGTYGKGPMAAVMQGQVARFSDKELEDFSQTIGK